MYSIITMPDNYIKILSALTDYFQTGSRQLYRILSGWRGKPVVDLLHAKFIGMDLVFELFDGSHILR